MCSDKSKKSPAGVGQPKNQQPPKGNKIYILISWEEKEVKMFFFIVVSPVNIC